MSGQGWLGLSVDIMHHPVTPLNNVPQNDDAMLLTFNITLSGSTYARRYLAPGQYLGPTLVVSLFCRNNPLLLQC